MPYVNNDVQTYSNPPRVGEIRTLDGTSTYTIAEAVRWDSTDMVVVLVIVTEYGRTTWKVYETPHTVREFANVTSYTSEEEASQSFLSRAFGM